MLKNFIVTFFYYTDARTEYRVVAKNSAEAVVLASNRLHLEHHVEEWCTPVEGREDNPPFHIQVRLAPLKTK